MPNKVRVIASVDGYSYSGKEAINLLDKHLRAMGIYPDLAMPKDLNGWQRIKWMYDLIPREKALFLFREPRHVAFNRSRYKKCASWHGCRVKKGKINAKKAVVGGVAFKPKAEEREEVRAMYRQIAKDYEQVGLGGIPPGAVMVGGNVLQWRGIRAAEVAPAYQPQQGELNAANQDLHLEDILGKFGNPHDGNGQ